MSLSLGTFDIFRADRRGQRSSEGSLEHWGVDDGYHGWSLGSRQGPESSELALEHPGTAWTQWFTQWFGLSWWLSVAPFSCWSNESNRLVQKMDSMRLLPHFLRILWSGFGCARLPSFLGTLMASLFIGCCMNGKAGNAKRISVQIILEQLLRAVHVCQPLFDCTTTSFWYWDIQLPRHKDADILLHCYMCDHICLQLDMWLRKKMAAEVRSDGKHHRGCL